VPRYDKCLNVSGDYVESGVYHLRHVCHLHIETKMKFLESECLFCCFIDLTSISYCKFSADYYGVTYILASLN
jgi:hypothetical protein